MVLDIVVLARGLLMPNLRPKLPLLPNPKLKLKLNLITDTVDTMALDTVDTTDIPTDTDTVISARGPLMLNPKLRLNLTTDTDITDIPTDTVDTTDLDIVDSTGVE